MLHRFRPVLLAFAGATFITSIACSSQADDNLNRAAVQYRDKDFPAAYASAGKSSDLAHRTFVRGMAALRIDKFDEAVALLTEAEQKVPLIADYAAFYQAEALQKLKKYPAASAKAASIRTSFPNSKVVRRSEKMFADILFESGDFKGASKSYQTYIEKYPAGGDAIDASYQSARCREELTDPGGALLTTG